MKQKDVKLAVFELGNYRIPRKIKMEAIASEKDTSDPTFREHLKKADDKQTSDLALCVKLFLRTL
ncbi:MAG: helix-turn-helix domain-containing protein [Thermoplasmata archaeon]